MIVQIQSDNHIEMDYNPFEIKIHPAAELLILAGDVFNFTLSNNDLRVLQKMLHNISIPVIYVPGNHEYYGESIESFKDKLSNYILTPLFHILDNSTVEIRGIKFIGSTLWSDFDGADKNPYFVDQAYRCLADFNYIKNFDLKTCKKLNKESRKFLNKELSGDAKKKFVITHFVPTYQAIPDKYAGNVLNPYFMCNCNSLIEKADWWVFGHTHSSFEFEINTCQLLCNPHGYGNENPDFKNTIIEI